MSKTSIKRHTMITLLLAVVVYGCAAPFLAYEAHVIATGATSLRAVGEIPKTEPYDSFFKQVSSAGTTGGLTIIASNKEIGSLSMEWLKYKQVKRFSFAISERNGKYTVDLTQNYKKHALKDELIKSALVIFSNIQKATGIDPEKMFISIEDETLTLNAWGKKYWN